MEAEISQLVEKYTPVAVDYGLRLLGALAIFVLGKLLARFLSNVVKRALSRSKMDDTLVKFLGNLTYIVLMVVVGIAVLGKLGVETASFLAVIGAAGLAIGLALQGSLSNFAAGVLIIIFRPFKVGDFVDAGGTAGSVKEIQLFTTILAHPDNRKLIVPNSQVLNSVITNFSDIENRRVDLVFGIAYDDDMGKARQVIQDVLSKETRILAEPATVIAVNELADSSVNFVVRPWVKPGDYWGVKWDLTEAVKNAFDAQGISIPFPQQDLHIKSGSLPS